MAVTIHLGPARLITPPTPPVVTGSLVWSNTGAINITQGTTYQLSADVTNTTGDPATYAYHGPVTTGVGPVARTTGALPATSTATVESKNSWFEVGTPDYPNISDASPYGVGSAPTSALLTYSVDWCHRLTWPTPAGEDGGAWLDANGTARGLNNPGTADSIVFTSANGSPAIVEQTFSTPAAKALVDKLRNYRNAGLHFRYIPGGNGPRCIARWHADGSTQGPLMTVYTDTNPTTGFACPCTISIFLSGGNWAAADGIEATQPSSVGATDEFYSPGVIKFDVSAVTGTTQAVKFRFRPASPMNHAINYLHLPPVNYRPMLDIAGNRVAGPATNIGDVRTDGLARTVSVDQNLEGLSDVLFYCDFTSLAVKDAKWNIQKSINPYTYSYLNPPNGAFAPWGVSTWRIDNISLEQTQNRVVEQWHQFIPQQPPQRDLYCGFMFRYSASVNTYSQDGWKLPGFETDWPSWQPGSAPAGTIEISWRGGMGSTSRTNPDYNQWHSQRYDDTSNSLNMYVDTYGMLKAERVYHIEQHIRTNDIGQANGIQEFYIDDVLVGRRTDAQPRLTQETRIITNPFVQIFHGGGLPILGGPMWFEIGRYTFSTKYVGAPRRIA